MDRTVRFHCISLRNGNALGLRLKHTAECANCISLRNGNALGSVSIGKTAATNCRNDLCDSLHCKLYISWNGCK